MIITPGSLLLGGIIGGVKGIQAAREGLEQYHAYQDTANELAAKNEHEQEDLNLTEQYINAQQRPSNISPNIWHQQQTARLASIQNDRAYKNYVTNAAIRQARIDMRNRQPSVFSAVFGSALGTVEAVSNKYQRAVYPGRW